MSAPLKLSASQVGQLGEFMRSISRSTALTGVRIDTCGNATLSIDGNEIEVCWDDEKREYVTDDGIGR